MEICAKLPSYFSSFICFLKRVYYRLSHTPEKAVRTWAGFGAAVHSVKALQVLLAVEPPEASVRDDDTVSGIELSFDAHGRIHRSRTRAPPLQWINHENGSWTLRPWSD